MRISTGVSPGTVSLPSAGALEGASDDAAGTSAGACARLETANVAANSEAAALANIRGSIESPALQLTHGAIESIESQRKHALVHQISREFDGRSPIPAILGLGIEPDQAREVGCELLHPDPP